MPECLLGNFWLSLEPVHKVEIRSQRWQEIRRTADECGEQIVYPEFLEPGCQVGKVEYYYKDEGADNLNLVFVGFPVGE